MNNPAAGKWHRARQPDTVQFAQASEASTGSRRGEFNFSRPRLAMAVQLLFAIEAGNCVAAPCLLNGYTVIGSVTNSVVCDNNGTLTTNAANGFLTNDSTGMLINNGILLNRGQISNAGLIVNNGSLSSAGKISGTGTLDNNGT